VGVSDAFDARQNVMGGAKYLRKLYDRFGNYRLAVAAYNAGPGNVQKYKGIPPFAETRAYVRTVMSRFGKSRLGGVESE
jgi:soluble lytic murein transglycosylase-like protein